MLNPDQLITFNANDFAIGRLLGVGGFSSVFSVSLRTGIDVAFDLFEAQGVINDLDETDRDDDLSIARTTACSVLSAQSSIYGDNNEQPQQLAIKKLHSTALDGGPLMTKLALRDLQNEVRILSRLPYHPNIIRMFGISTDFWEHLPERAFIVQEQLVESLDTVIDRCKRQATSGILQRIWNRKKYLSENSQIQRIKKVAIGISRAMSFLHERRVIFRDLKPSNVGIDGHGRARLLDFGLAQKLGGEIEEEDSNNRRSSRRRSRHKDDNESLYVPGGQKVVGTVRYMAPEVARLEPYTFSADVYSFALVVWELCTLQRPYHKIKSKRRLRQKVMMIQSSARSSRPRLPCSLSHIASPELQILLSDCWLPKPSLRPSFDLIQICLEIAIEASEFKQAPKTLNEKRLYE